ncbi:hypothetical protein ACH5RR_006622 [Cinchona calisaya]|uniref:Uncharacterized protein n=1 Tax=Cinchona calisaya TaxID=153742 RepID=A0ABD3API5_9GENT
MVRNHGNLVNKMLATTSETDEEDDMQGLIHEALGNINSTSAIHGTKENFDFGFESENDIARDEETTNFFKLLKHTKEELSKGCKTKDNLNALYDLKEMRIRKALHPQLKNDKVEKLKTSSNDNDYHKKVSYLASGPNK